METSYDAKVWKIDVYNGARTTTYRVRWEVAGRPWHESFRTHALADAFRSELLRAARRGEAFLVETGRPISMDRAERRVNWLVFAREYAAMKWRQHAPNSERRLLTENPITALPRKAPKIAQEVDRRVVVNPVQARALLNAVAAEKPSGDRLAFFGAMYYAARRPAEAMTLRKVNLALPAEGWGELLLDSSSAVAGSPWTDSGGGGRNVRSNTALGAKLGSSPARPR